MTLLYECSAGAEHWPTTGTYRASLRAYEPTYPPTHRGNGPDVA